MQSTHQLNDNSGGRWHVVTETSRYVVDLDERTLTRLPGSASGAAPGRAPVELADLRGDHTEIQLLTLVQCQLHRSMVLLIEADDTDGPRFRLTTMVRAIYPATPSAARTPPT